MEQHRNRSSNPAHDVAARLGIIQVDVMEQLDSVFLPSLRAVEHSRTTCGYLTAVWNSYFSKLMVRVAVPPSRTLVTVMFCFGNQNSPTFVYWCLISVFRIQKDRLSDGSASTRTTA